MNILLCHRQCRGMSCFGRTQSPETSKKSSDWLYVRYCDGELMWQLPDTHPLIRMCVGMFFAILFGAAIGPAPVVPIQAGVSVALVLAMGPESAGGTRLVDVLLGASVGLLFSRAFTSNPFSDIGRSTSDFLRQLGNGMDRMLRACEVQSSKGQKPL